MTEADAINKLRNAKQKDSRTLWRDAIDCAHEARMSDEQIASETGMTIADVIEQAQP